MKYRRGENTIEGQRERDEGEGERNRGRYSKFPRGQPGKIPPFSFWNRPPVRMGAVSGPSCISL